ncbi:cardiolipin synthase [Salipaludibacillus sp. LMS25]|uniref:cardiolipin synthase n=1 Tax=Salipaludibacillus sp. LMS25 TaxID=2924031 RepID=UPI0020D08647|nr:cardiolipin synthase [Salipaludibacillus sp. LMS25]UTR13118.1 cardiolipin synthase [Salipaludibacillus sp. LMS25]
MNKNLKIIIPIASLLIIGIAIYQYTNIFKEEIYITYSADFPVTEELEEMAEEAEVIAFGTYEGLNSNWNMARDPNDPSKEDQENYVEGKLYDFQVEEYILGDGDEKIQINLRYKEEIKVEDSEGKIHTIENVDPLFIEPEIGEKYIVFLKKDDDFGNYYGAIEPFQVVFDAEERAILKTNLTKEHSEEAHENNSIEIQGENVIVNIENHVEEIEDNISGQDFTEIKSLLEDSN